MTDDRAVTLDVLALVTGRDAADITPEMELVADLELDSLKAVRLLVELEDRLDAEIPDEEASRLKTVGDVLAYVDSRGAGR